jgi:NADPH:quinone reductase-like Zn-dependent oxidoreductase
MTNGELFKIKCIINAIRYTTVKKTQIMPVSKSLPNIEFAAALPEAWLTAYLGLKQLGRIQ